MVSDVIMNALQSRGESKQWLANNLNLSYSTLHQKLTNNTFTAEELIKLCQIFNLSLEHFIQQDNNDVIDLKKIAIERRPNVLIEDINNFQSAGMHIESEHTNGALYYIPYGIAKYIGKKDIYLNIILDGYQHALENSLKASKDDVEKRVKLENMQYDLTILKQILNILFNQLKELDEL